MLWAASFYTSFALYLASFAYISIQCPKGDFTAMKAILDRDPPDRVLTTILSAATVTGLPFWGPTVALLRLWGLIELGIWRMIG